MSLTISDSEPRRQYTGNGVQTAFSANFEFRAASDVVCNVDGVTKTLNTDYTLTGAGVSGGGTLTFTSAQANGAIITIYRDMSIARTADQYASYGQIPAEVLEQDLDDITMKMQQLEVLVGRASRVSMTETVTASDMEWPSKATRAGKYAYWNATTGKLEPATQLTAGTTLSQSTIGSYLYPRTAAEIGAGITPTQYHYPELNVKRYGATGDGSTDDITAITNALTVGAYLGAMVYMPPGKYIVSTPVRIPEATGLDGAGYMGGAYAGTVQGTSIWAKSTFNQPTRGIVESYNVSGGGLQEFSPVRNLSIFGNRTNGAVAAAGLLLKSVFVNTVIRDVMIQEVDGDGIKLDGGSGGGPVELQNLWINNVEGHCLEIVEGFQYVRVRDVAFERWGRHATSGTKNAIRVTSSAGTDVSRFLLVDGFYSELEPGKNHDCIYLENCSYVDLRNMSAGGGNGTETGSFIRWRQTAGSAPYAYPRGSSVLGFRADFVYVGTSGVKSYAKTIWDEANSITRTDDYIRQYVAPEPIITIGSSGAPAFANSWVNRSGGYQTAGYFIDGEGFVNLVGGIKSGTVGSSAFTLPAGARPAAAVAFSVISNGAVGLVEVQSSGNVVPTTPSNNTYVSLDGIRFKALG